MNSQSVIASSNRLESLSLLIEPTREETQEKRTLQQHIGKQSPVALDVDNDPDPNCDRLRLQVLARELYDQAKHKSERSCAIAERMYSKRSKELNSVGLSS